MKSITILLCILLVTAAPVFAQEADVDPGITPDSFLYRLDVAMDQISLLMTFDKSAKAKKGLEIAEERLSEIKAMAQENKLEAMEKGQKEHSKALEKTISAVKDLEKDDSTEEIEDVIEIEKKLEEHEAKIEKVKDELKVRIKVKGDLTEEQEKRIDSILSRLENQTGRVKIEIDNKKGRTKIKIKVETGKTEVEIESEVEDIERKKGLTDFRKKRAEEQMEDAREDIEDIKEKMLETNVTDKTALEQLLREAEAKLERSESLYAEGKYGATFGQAKASESLAKNVKKLLEKEKETSEDEEDKTVVKVEIRGDQATVKVEIDDEDMKFTMDTTNKAEIVSEIVTRTGLTLEEVENVVTFKEKEERSRAQRFEIGNKSEKRVKKTLLEAEEEETLEEEETEESKTAEETEDVEREEEKDESETKTEETPEEAVNPTTTTDPNTTTATAPTTPTAEEKSETKTEETPEEAVKPTTTPAPNTTTATAPTTPTAEEKSETKTEETPEEAVKPTTTTDPNTTTATAPTTPTAEE